jgi:hypothetical protein
VAAIPSGGLERLGVPGIFAVNLGSVIANLGSVIAELPFKDPQMAGSR